MVSVTNQNKCFSKRTIQVNTSESAILENVEIDDIGLESDISITVSGTGNYEFSLDDGFFQLDNTFFNVSPGFHIVSIKDLNGCDTNSEKISVFGFPKFFTPNNDGENDTWNPIGMSALDNPITNIYIFNRFGKLLINLNPLGNGWDGIVNGAVLPSSDYWYRIIFEDGKVYNGHFSLKR